MLLTTLALFASFSAQFSRAYKFKPADFEEQWFNNREKLEFRTRSIATCAIHAQKIDAKLPFSLESGSCQVLHFQGNKTFPTVFPEGTNRTKVAYITDTRVENGERRKKYSL